MPEDVCPRNSQGHERPHQCSSVAVGSIAFNGPQIFPFVGVAAKWQHVYLGGVSRSFRGIMGLSPGGNRGIGAHLENAPAWSKNQVQVIEIIDKYELYV
jgi:hypothetical protein